MKHHQSSIDTMQIKRQSHFKDEKQDVAYFEDWVKRLEHANKRRYGRHVVRTTLGKTHVWSWSTCENPSETLIVFPGARTTSLFWDFDKNLDHLNADLKIYMVETNGLPNLSDGFTPDIKSLDYGRWAAQVLEGLDVEKAFVAGASFGGLVCMKLAITNPEKVKAAFLLNPGCLQPFSMSVKNLFANLLPIVSPTRNNVRRFLDTAIFSKPNHGLSPLAEELLVDYEVFALKRYNDRSQKPYFMANELDDVNVRTYLFLGDSDLLFPADKSIRSARIHLKNLSETKVFANVGHGIETYAETMAYLGEKIRSFD